MRDQTPCGCVEGFIGLMIGLAVFARVNMGSPGGTWLRTLALAIGYGLGGAVIGKVVGLTRPRFR